MNVRKLLCFTTLYAKGETVEAHHARRMIDTKRTENEPNTQDTRAFPRVRFRVHVLAKLAGPHPNTLPFFGPCQFSGKEPSYRGLVPPFSQHACPPAALWIHSPPRRRLHRQRRSHVKFARCRVAFPRLTFRDNIQYRTFGCTKLTLISIQLFDEVVSSWKNCGAMAR